MLSFMLRLPSPAFPAEIRTGNARIDAYLEALDHALVGAVNIRKQTLLEARDFLTESLTHARDAGSDEDAALREAVAGFGDIKDVAREQRAARRKMFWSLAWRMGLAFASLMLAMQLLDRGLSGISWQMLAGSFVFLAVFFGGSMGYFGAYLSPKSMPTSQDASGSDAFTVRYKRMSVIMCWGLLLALGAIEALVAAGLAGFGPLRDWSTPVAIFLLTINLKTMMAAAASLRFKAEVHCDRVVLSGLGGQVQILREQVVSLTVPGMLIQLVWPGFGKAHRLTWRDASGRLRSRSLSCNQELVHGDRLMAWLESAAGQHAVSTSLVQRLR